MVESQEIELQGHIIDSGIMTQLFDRVMDMGGNFEILVFDDDGADVAAGLGGAGGAGQRPGALGQGWGLLVAP